MACSCTYERAGKCIKAY